MKRKNLQAFTLIEVLIAIAIVALAASLIMPVVNNNKEKAAYEVSVINLGSVAKAMEHHYLEKGAYPVIKDWNDLTSPESPLAEYINEIPTGDKKGRPYIIKESTESSYMFEGSALGGKLAKDYPDYRYSTGAKFKKGKKGS